MIDPELCRPPDGDEHAFLSLAHEKAIECIHRNITPLGFSACSYEDNHFYGTDMNYRAVWARDGALTVLWTLQIDDAEVQACQRRTLETLLEHQAPNGQIPISVCVDTDEPDYSGVGYITAIDSPLWLIMACYRFGQESGDWSIVDQHIAHLRRAMAWLSAHDANQCGLIEVPEAGDWTDLFARSYHVLYDEVLWHRCLVYYSRILRRHGETAEAAEYERLTDRVERRILTDFWPTNGTEIRDGDSPTFTQTQYSLGETRYLIAQLTPFSFSWRCDVYANILAYLTDLVDEDRAWMTFRFLWGSGVSQPAPVKNLYPPVHTGDSEWREYFVVNMLNLPHHYHNGGIWPFIGGMWVRYVHKLGMRDLAHRELIKLAELCHHGLELPWEFNEWHHARTGRAMGKKFQACSAASFIRACRDLAIEPEHMPQRL
jgi:glycogen debranching enzyme